MKKFVYLFILIVTLTLSACDVEYTSVNLQEMHNNLNDNPVGAEQKYLDEYISVENVTIDIIHHYNSIWVEKQYGNNRLGMDCIFDDKSSIKESVANLRVGDTVTVKGKVTRVGGGSQYGAPGNIQIWLMSIEKTN